MPTALGTVASHRTGSVSSWTPQDLPNLLTWIDAADTTSISQTGGAVTQINDVSGNGRHFVGGTNKPITGASTMNSKNVLDFTNDRLMFDAGSDVLDVDPFTVLVVARMGTGAMSNRMVSFLTTANNTAAIDYEGGAAVAAFAGPYASLPNLQSLSDGYGPYLTVPPGVPVRLRSVKDGTTWTVAVDDTEATNSHGSALNLVRYVYIGANPFEAGFTGSLCELVLCNAVLSSTDLAEWKDYVDYKWLGIGGGGSGGGATFHIPASINNDGTIEVGLAINDWLDTVPNDAVVEFDAGATYWAEETLYVAGRHDLIFEGNGARFEQRTNGDATTPVPGYDDLWPRCRAVWLVNGGTNLEFRNMDIYGGNPPGGDGFSPYMGQGYEEQHAFYLDGPVGVKIHDNTVTRMFGDFVTLIGAGSNVDIISNTATCIGRQGVAIVDGTDVLIQGNTLDHITRSAFDVEPAVASMTVRRVTIDDNDVSWFINVFIANLGDGGNCSDITVTNNRLSGERTTVSVSARGPVGVPRRSNYVFLNNVTTTPDGGPGQGMMRFEHIDGVRIENTHQPVVGKYPADASIYSGNWAFVDDCTNVVVRNNVAYEAPQTQITTLGVTLLNGSSAATAVHCGNITDELQAGPPVDGVCP